MSSKNKPNTRITNKAKHFFHKIVEILISCFFAFRQSTKIFFKSNAEFSANLDPFYLGGVLYIPTFIKNIKKQLFYIVPIVIYAIFQTVILHDLNIVKLTINVTKIILCIFTLLYVMSNYNKVSILKITKWATLLIFITTLVSLFFQNSTILWRFNDVINKYDETRLHGLFLEPSELGFHTMILIIILFSYLLTKKAEGRFQASLLILLNIITLILARPFGAIAIGVFTIILMATIMIIKNRNKKYYAFSIFAGIICLFTSIAMIQLQNPLAMRLIDTLNGKDLSNNYRIGVAIDTTFKSLDRTSGAGIGFGNLNTEKFRTEYSDAGVTAVIANSFPYFIIESGIFGILFLIALWGILLKHLFSKFNYLQLGLLVFLFLYQIVGGHFTSGLTWALYGLCLSDFDWKDKTPTPRRVETNKKTKILFLHTGAEMYGADQILLKITSNLNKNQFTPIVVLPSTGPLKYELDKKHIKTIVIPYPIIRRQYFTPSGIIHYAKEYRTSIKKLAKFTKDEQIDIIHNNTIAVLQGISLKKRLQIPVIFHIHEMLTKPHIIAKTLYKLANSYADRIIVVSDAVKNHIERIINRQSNKIITIHNGIEPCKKSSLHQSPNLEIPRNKKIVATIGRVNAIKGQDDFVDMMSILDNNYHGLIIGDAFRGQEWRVEELNKKIEQLGLLNKISYLGFRNDIQEIINSIDALVIPSVKKDSLPTVALEAMRAKKPVIAYKCGGVEEIIKNGENGFLVEQGDVQGLAKATQRCLQSNARYIQLSNNAFSTIRQHFNIDSFINKIEQEYAVL